MIIIMITSHDNHDDDDDDEAQAPSLLVQLTLETQPISLVEQFLKDHFFEKLINSLL